MTRHVEREHAGFTTRMHCKHPQNESNSNVLGKPNNNNGILLAGPTFSGKTFLMLKILSRIPNPDVYIITKSPREQYFNSKIKIKEITEEIKPLKEYENTFVLFDDNLCSSNSGYINQFFVRGRHFKLKIFYLSQSYYVLPKRKIRNNSNKLILINQKLKDIENI